MEHNKRNEREVNKHVKHSQEKKKYTQDLGYPNLPQQQYCPSSTATLFDQKNNIQSPFFLFSEINFTLENQPPTLENRGAIYTKFRGLTAS